MTFADKIIHYYQQLTYNGKLPLGIHVMNPFRESTQVMGIVKKFYGKYYNDNKPRHMILGINPGRFGGGMTGIPFTDPKRLISECKIQYEGKITHEPSSVFVYDVINAYGGPDVFYKDIYINSLCPLGFTNVDTAGREKNYNYYDSKELFDATKDFIIDNIHKQIKLGIQTDVCFAFGTGKNEKILRALNEEYSFFEKIVALEHPRYIMQYKNADRQFYIDKYMAAFKGT